jgi:hypothetical protein
MWRPDLQQEAERGLYGCKKLKLPPVLNKLTTMTWRHMGEWRYNSIILDLCIRQRWAFSFMYLLLYSWGKSPGCPLDRRLGGPQSWSECCAEEKILPCQELNLGCPSHHYTDWDISTPMWEYLSNVWNIWNCLNNNYAIFELTIGTYGGTPMAGCYGHTQVIVIHHENVTISCTTWKLFVLVIYDVYKTSWTFACHYWQMGYMGVPC